MWVSPKITLAGGVGSGCQRWARRGCCNAPDSGGGPQTRTGTRGLGQRGPNQRAKGQHLIDVRAAWAVDGGDGEWFPAFLPRTRWCLSSVWNLNIAEQFWREWWVQFGRVELEMHVDIQVASSSGRREKLEVGAGGVIWAVGYLLPTGDAFPPSTSSQSSWCLDRRVLQHPEVIYRENVLCVCFSALPSKWESKTPHSQPKCNFQSFPPTTFGSYYQKILTQM